MSEIPTMQVWPGPGRRQVRCPDGRLLVPGQRVPQIQFWVRRLRCGDVVLEAPAETAESPERPKKGKG